MVILITVFEKVLSLLSFLSRKKIIYIKKVGELGNNAILSPFGFWYVGNIYDTTDIAYGIANEGDVEKEGIFVKNIIQSMLAARKEVTFYDIGANTGYFGILSNYIGKGLVTTHFFEPLSEHTSCIEKTIYLNRLENTTKVHTMGLGNENISKIFHIAGSGSTFDSSFIGNAPVPTRAIDVKRLDDYTKEKSIVTPDFMKIDVEGYELAVLQGAQTIIETSHPVIYIEIAKNLKSIGRTFENNQYRETLEFITKLGYACYLVEDNMNFIPVGLDDVSVESGVHMYLCLHDNHSFIKCS